MTDGTATPQGTDREDTDDRREIDAWLLDMLDQGGGTADAKDVMKAVRAAGFSIDQAKRAKKRLKIDSVKNGMDGGWNWVAPVEGSTKGSKGAALRTPPPSHPSVLPSHPADRWRVSGEPINKDSA